MPSQRASLLNILAGTVAVSILSALFLPLFSGGRCNTGNRCAGNLRQLYQLGCIYASTHHGQWPEAKGSELWLSFAKMSPPLIETDHLEVLLCPVKGDADPGQCDYLGPRSCWSELGPHDALAADKPGNHGEGLSGNVLLKDGSVQEYEYSHPIWDTLAP